jgi:uncharacterized protein (TIGR00725 family)
VASNSSRKEQAMIEKDDRERRRPIRYPIVGVIGASRIDADLRAVAYDVGRLIAERDAILVCGGLSGVMEAACQGAYEHDGVTIGILPTDDTYEANPYVQIPIATGFGVGRNIVIVRTADVLIAVGGSYGTLSEIAHALNLGKRVVHLESWDLDQAGVVDAELYVQAETPEEAVERALEYQPGPQ